MVSSHPFEAAGTMLYRNVVTPSAHGLLLINVNDQIIGKTVSTYGGWDVAYVDMLKEVIRRHYPESEPMDIVDCGANIGIYALSLAKIDDFKIRMHAIEAQRLVFQMLNANMALNSLDNVWTYHAYVSNKDGESTALPCADPNVPANFGAFEVESPSGHSEFDGKLLAPETVQSLTIDSLQLENCTVIKIDVEGMEVKAIEGAMNTIAKSRPILFFERHRCDYDAIKDLLRPYDYQLFELGEHNTLAIRKEWEVKIEPSVKVEV
jgi:FkbM family methyltransferase